MIESTVQTVINIIAGAIISYLLLCIVQRKKKTMP